MSTYTGESLDLDVESDEDIAVKNWRFDRFASLRDNAGNALSDLNCALLAETGQDWHAFSALLLEGCSVEFAFDIVA